MQQKQLLTDEFISKYPDFPEHMNAIARFTYLRTYSRWLPEEKRRETWKETVRRAVEYNVSLDPRYGSVLKKHYRELRREAEKLFDNIFNLRQFLAGRTLWIGGTEAAKRYPMANFNCSFIVMDDLSKFKELFYLLMLGTGVGFRILKEDVAKLPKFRQDVKLTHRPYNPVAKAYREDNTSVIFQGEKAAIYVGDSKEGWTQALDWYLNILTDHAYHNIKEIEIIYDNVRPKGERLKTFGGTASGHESLKTMFKKIHNAITTDKYAPKAVDGKLRPIHVLDICNIIGENVVVGGVRRTSEIALGSMDDEEFLHAKKNLTPDRYHRFMSNNSIYYDKKPTREQLRKQFEVLKNEGEPCFVNAVAASKRRPDFKGVNPCVEILLADRGLCNLTTTNVLAFVKNGKLMEEELLEAHALSARAGYRMTCVDLELPKWDAQQKKDRLTGVSVTGWKDAIEALGYTEEQEADLMRKLHVVARRAADDYADELGLSRSLLVTAVKPEGTLSLVAGAVSSGLHYAHSPYYVRRIRINAHDPLCKAVEHLGWRVFNEVGQGVEIDGEITPVMTKVIEFPVKSPSKRTKYEVSAIEQLETYYRFQENYTEHNSSNTISVKDHEWEGVEQNIWDNWDRMVAVSFLKLDGHIYELAPYEAITKEEYEERVAEMAELRPELLQQFEDNGEDLDAGNDGCEGGACPIR